MERITACTYFGYIQTTKDALLVFEAVRQNRLPKITRRLREEERASLIRSGAVFVFDEAESGVKRWTDGLYWSPSRILNNFLVYRQIEKQPPPSADANGKAKRKEHVRFSASDGAPQVPTEGSTYGSFHGPQGGDPGPSTSSSLSRGPGSEGLDSGFQAQVETPTGGIPDPDRALVGSLTSSFPFRKDGLCKKTISFPVGNSHQHLISYYTIEDVLRGRLRTPSSLPELDALTISPELLNRAHFRNPPQIEQDEDGIPRYRGEPLETPANPKRRSGAPGSGDESLPDHRGLIGAGEPPGSIPFASGSIRMTPTPYSPASATGMTGPVDDFRAHPSHQAYSSPFGQHPSQTPFQFAHMDSSMSASGGFLPGTMAVHQGSDQHFGNRRRVASDAPTRLAQLRAGGARYEPYPSLHSSDGGHAALSSFSTGYAGSSDSHMSSPANRRDMGMMPGGRGSLSPVDSRPQSARLYGEQSNGLNHNPTGSAGWRNDAGYVPTPPGATSGTIPSPRDTVIAPPLPQPTGVGTAQTPLSAGIPPNEYLQTGRGGSGGAAGPGGGTQDAPTYYHQPSMQGYTAQLHTRGQASAIATGPGTGHSDGPGAMDAGGSGAHVVMQGMSSGSMLPDQRLQGGDAGGGAGPGSYVYFQSNGSASGGPSGGMQYPMGPSMSASDRSLSSDLSGPRSEGNFSANAPYYPNMGTWAAPPTTSTSSDMTQEAVTLQAMQGQGQAMPSAPPSSAASSSHGTFRPLQPGSISDWRLAQEAHHAHRSNSMSSDFSAAGGPPTGPPGGMGTSIDWTRTDTNMYGGTHTGPEGALRSPLNVLGRDASNNSLKRVMLRRPPSNN